MSETNRNTHSNCKRQVFISFLLLAAGLVTLYEYYLPPIRRHYKKRYPYALLLGCPAHADGSLCTAAKKRCNLAIKAWEENFYEALIISGGAVKNEFIEAQIMKDYIQKQNPNIPVLLETQARNTWENIQNTYELTDDVPILIITGDLHGRRAQAMAKDFYSDAAMLCYKDRKLKHIIREIPSRILYIKLELEKIPARMKAHYIHTS